MDNTGERWLPVHSQEGSYEVSNDGRVRSLDRVVLGRDGRSIHCRGRILQPWSNGSSGHLVVTLGSAGRRYVHRIVLEAFRGPCPIGMEACHADDVPSNNTLDNLRWASRAANALDRQRNNIDPRVNLTHCKHGHKFTPENTHIRPGGGRTCKQCRLRRKREENQRRPSAA